MEYIGAATSLGQNTTHLLCSVHVVSTLQLKPEKKSAREIQVCEYVENICICKKNKKNKNM